MDEAKGGRTSEDEGGIAELRREEDADASEYLDKECKGSSFSDAVEMMEDVRELEYPVVDEVVVADMRLE